MFQWNQPVRVRSRLQMVICAGMKSDDRGSVGALDFQLLAAPIVGHVQPHMRGREDLVYDALASGTAEYETDRVIAVYVLNGNLAQVQIPRYLVWLAGRLVLFPELVRSSGQRATGVSRRSLIFAALPRSSRR